jgi:hypothetical protein
MWHTPGVLFLIKKNWWFYLVVGLIRRMFLVLSQWRISWRKRGGQEQKVGRTISRTTSGVGSGGDESDEKKEEDFSRKGLD